MIMALKTDKCQIARDFGHCRHCAHVRLMRDVENNVSVGNVEKVRRLRYLRKAGQITLRQAILWYFGKVA